MVQPLRRPVGRGGAAELSSNRATATAGQPAQDHGRQQARGRGVRGWSASCRGVHKGQQQMFLRLPPREPPSVNQAAMQGPSAPTRLCWWGSSAAVGGGRTLSTCSRSIISTTFRPPSGRLNGCWLGNYSLTASS